jgi:hypothetical protein
MPTVSSLSLGSKAIMIHDFSPYDLSQGGSFLLFPVLFEWLGKQHDY